MKQQPEFLRGLTDGIPIGLGYLSVSFAFGIFAVEQGLSPLEAVMISMTCVTSAGQLAAVPIITGGGSLLTLALSQLVINMRYALMSISLTQKFAADVRIWDRLWIAFGNTDEIFAMASGQKGAVSKWYFMGLILISWSGWALGTTLGALAGNILPAIVTSALGVAIYGMFVAIVIPAMRERRATAWCVLLAVTLSCAFRYLPLLSEVSSGFAIILCAVTASALLAYLAPLEQEGDV